MSSCEPIAITGIGCRFPGANGPEAFWQLLKNGVDAVGEVPADRWSLAAYFDARAGQRGKSVSRCGGFVTAIDRFDAGFFGISPREAAFIDPQHRMLLQSAWEALEDAGEVAGQALATGVFVGVSTNDYAHLQIAPEDHESLDIWSSTGGVASIAANRISYCLDLRGPSIAVDTACSSALVAVHLACESLRRKECRIALAGGVNALLFPAPFISFSRSGMLSPDGRCQAFDARANGFVRAEGVGVVVLKPLSDAFKDGDLIYSVIRATAVNQDGRTSGLTMPSREAQARLVREACLRGGVAPGEIQYVEAHGTGTAVGDPIEAAALGEVLREGRNPNSPCVIGSVKTNIGHLEAGAGIAGLIKTALSLSHREIPPSLHFQTPNPAIDFEGLGLRVGTTQQSYREGGLPLAGVNSFGFGGANAHAILQAHERLAPRQSNKETGRALLLALSARSQPALKDMAAKYADFLAGETQPTLGDVADVAFCAGAFRTHHPHRLAVAAEDLPDLLFKLRRFTGDTLEEGVSQRSESSVGPVFVFSGQGPQWWGMGRELFAQEAVFRSVIEKCDALFREAGKWSLIEELHRDESSSRMSVTAIAQPAIFALQMGLVALWESWGIRPAAIVGHSVGEAAAACTAGILSLKEAARVIMERGRCMELAGGTGKMLAVGLSPEEVNGLLVGMEDQLCIGSINGPRSVVISGDAGPLESLAAELESRDVFCRWLPVNYAFHSHQMESVREEILGALGGLTVSPARISIVSSVTGVEAGHEDFQTEYWWRNVREPVRFAAAIQRLVAGGSRTFLEVGPHPVLSTAIRECVAEGFGECLVLPSLRRGKPERLTLLSALGALYVAGSDVDWKALYPSARRVRLPSYAWQLERYWHESPGWEKARLSDPVHPLLTRRADASAPAWSGTLDLEKMPFLSHHQVRGQTVFPAAGFIDAALAMAPGAEVKTLADFDIRAALPLAQDGGPLRFEMAGCPDDSCFRISTRPDRRDAEWTCHVTGRFAPTEQASLAEGHDLAALKTRCLSEVSVDDVYEEFRRCGLLFGPSFRGIERVWRGEGEALARVSLPSGLSLEGYSFHPALLDSCLQILSQALPVAPDSAAPLFLPVHCDRIRSFRSAATTVWSHAVLLQHTERSLIGDIRIFDEAGTLLLEIVGFQCLAATRRGASDALEDTFYQLQWKALRSHSRVSLPPLPRDESRNWIILGDRIGLGEKLAEKLSKLGDRALCLADSSESADPQTSFQQMLSEAAELGEVHGVIHLWHLDFAGRSPDDTLLHSAKNAGWFSLVGLVQALGKTEIAPRLFVVTRGAQFVTSADSPCVLQSGALGLARVLMSEYQKLQCRLIDLDPADPGGPGDLCDLLGEMEFTDSESEVAWRGGTRHGARLVRSAFSEVLRAHCPESKTDDFRMEFDRSGGRRTLVARPIARTAPGPGEVEVEVNAVALNFRDVMKSLGIYPGENNDLPGDEFAGRVSALGEGVEGFAKGDRVLAMAPGSFRKHITLLATQLFHVPKRMSDEEAATIPVAFVTAWYALHDLGHIGNGETILIHAAAGGVGMAAIQVAMLAGATVFASAGSPEKREFLKSLGVKHVLDSRTLAFGAEVRALTDGRGVDLVLNSLAGEAINTGLSALAPGGRFLEIGKRDIYQNARLELRPFRHSLSFFAIDLAQVAPKRIRLLLSKVMERMESGALSALPLRTFAIDQAEEAFSQMSRALHIGKLVLRMEAMRPVPEPRSVVLRQDVSYLITGGLSGFGLAVAEWMVRNEARHLVLASRRGLEDPASKEIEARLRAAGAEVLVLKLDVSVADEVRRAVETITKVMPAIGGIIHAAMVIEDKTLAGLDAESFGRVLAPKCDGAWNLHALGLPLDFFVMCSSVVSLIGSAGQGSYAAANSFLDSLAHYRRGLGLPALTINWGLLGEIGYVSRNAGLKSVLESSGFIGLRPDEVTSALGRLLGSTLCQAGIVRVNWETAARHNPFLSASARFENLVQAPGFSTPEGSGFRARMEALPTNKRPEAMLAELREQLAFVLRATPSSLDVQAPLNALGLDSLMSLELTTRMEKELGLSLPLGTIHSASTLTRLSATLCEWLDGGKPSPAPPTEAIPATVSQPVVSSRVSVPISVSDIEARMEELLQPTWLHQIEAVALRGLIAWFGKGDLASAYRRLHHALPLAKVFLRRDWLWADRNLRLIYGENLTPVERSRLAALAFENHLRSYVEGLRAADLACDFHSPHHLLDALAGGRGVILCGVHLGTWEPVFRIGSQAGVPIVGVYRRAQNPISDRRFQTIRAAYKIEWIESRDVTGIAQALDEKKVVALMTDLNTLSGGLETDFLGVPAMGPSGPARLALLKNCPLVPALALRAADGRVDVHFESPIYPADEPPAQLARRINAVFEPWILEYAEQYNWLHPRWRARPDGSLWDLKTPLAQLLAAKKSPYFEPSPRIRSLLA